MLISYNYKTFAVGKEEDIPLSKIDRGLPGDQMEYNHKYAKWTVKQQATHPLLVGTLDVKSKYVYGMSSRGVSQYLFTPYNESYPPFIVGCSTKDKSTNKIVLVKIGVWAQDSKFPHGDLVNTLGNCGDFLTEAKALYWQYSPWTLKKELQIPSTTAVLPRTNKIDITKHYTINIDPAGCKDIDDVITIYKEGDATILVISIADCADVVDCGGLIDEHACKVGQSLYSEFLPPRNMLPANLSEDVLSLIPGQTRYAVSLFVCIIDSEIVSTEFKETVLINKASFSYENVQKNAPPEFTKKIRKAADIIGCSDLEDPHKWVESFMIYYNSMAAITLYERNVGIFRGQKESQIEKLENYENICPELAHEAAQFTKVNGILPHYSLGLDKYCYATSPIRRYVDIVNQRYLKSIIHHEWEYLLYVNQDRDGRLIETLNACQKAAKRHSRDDFLLKQIAENPEKIVKGIVFSVSDDDMKIRVYIPEWKRIISVRGENHLAFDEEDEVSLRYYYNPNQTSWKNRIVFQVVI
jgi:exoribonuclease R